MLVMRMCGCVLGVFRGGRAKGVDDEVELVHVVSPREQRLATQNLRLKKTVGSMFACDSMPKRQRALCSLLYPLKGVP